MTFEGLEFRHIPGYRGYYVSSCGILLSIRRRFPRLLSTYQNVQGYIVSVVYDDGSNPYLKQVHRLVYEAWVGPILSGLVIDHVDGNKTNNDINNLEAVTQKENCVRAYKLGLSKPRGYSFKGETNPNAKLSDEDVRSIRSKYATGEYTQQQVADIYNTTRTHVSRLVCFQQRGEVA